MTETGHRRKGYFDVVTQEQTYLNILYLLLSFPLGVFYFVVMVTGFALGAGLLVIWIGVPILALMFVLCDQMVVFEYTLIKKVLNLRIPPLRLERPKGERILERLKNRLFDSASWVKIGYLFIKFPLGIIMFTISITLIALTLGMITAPITYQYVPITTIILIDTLNEAVVVCILGFFIGFLSLKGMNCLARMMGNFSAKLLTAQQDELYTTEM